MCCPGPDSCSGHKVTSHEHHFATQNIHLLSCNPLSQVGEKPTSTEHFFSLTNIPTDTCRAEAHTGHNSYALQKIRSVSQHNCCRRACSWPRSCHGSIYPTAVGTKSQCLEGTGCQRKAIHPLQGVGAFVMTEGERGS